MITLAEAREALEDAGYIVIDAWQWDIIYNALGASADSVLDEVFAVEIGDED